MRRTSGLGYLPSSMSATSAQAAGPTREVAMTRIVLRDGSCARRIRPSRLLADSTSRIACFAGTNASSANSASISVLRSVTHCVAASESRSSSPQARSSASPCSAVSFGPIQTMMIACAGTDRQPVLAFRTASHRCLRARRLVLRRGCGQPLVPIQTSLYLRIGAPRQSKTTTFIRGIKTLAPASRARRPHPGVAGL